MRMKFSATPCLREGRMGVEMLSEAPLLWSSMFGVVLDSDVFAKGSTAEQRDKQHRIGAATQTLILAWSVQMKGT